MAGSNAVASQTSAAFTTTDAIAESAVTSVTRRPDGPTLLVTTGVVDSLIVTDHAVAGSRSRGLFGLTVHLEFVHFALPRLEHSLIFGRDPGLLTRASDRETGVQDLPPHIYGEGSEERPLEDVGPTEFVAPFGATQFEPE